MKKSTEEKIEDLWNTSREYSSIASKVARQLAFGEGAIFWIFFHDYKNLSFIIASGLLFLVLYFVFDIAQYVIGAWTNKYLACVYDEKNKKNLASSQITRPPSMNNPMYVCYYLKFFMLGIASLLLMGLFIASFICKSSIIGAVVKQGRATLVIR